MSSTHALRLCTALASVVLLITVAACVPATTLPDDCDADSVQREVTLTADALSPSPVEVCRGQQVTIGVEVQADGELHFHGYDDQVPEQEVSAGESVTAEFDADTAGQFPIELHSADGSETEVGTLVVNEP